jgi:phosphotransferase system IIA component
MNNTLAHAKKSVMETNEGIEIIIGFGIETYNYFNTKIFMPYEGY